MSKITIAFTGDVMLGRLVNEHVIIGDKPLTYVWGDMIDSKSAFLSAKGIKIAVIAFTDNMPEWQATKTKPKVDILIVSAHWGPNMRQRPTKAFKEFAHAVIDAGADIFHGHSAHIFQGIEIYKGKLIMYDTGDFIDDYAVDDELRNDQTFLFLVTLSKNRIEKI